MAPHVQQALQALAQSKAMPGGGRAVAAHVQRAVAGAMQPKAAPQTRPAAGPAAHLRAVVSAAQAKGLAGAAAVRQPAARVPPVTSPARRAVEASPRGVVASWPARFPALQRSKVGTGDLGFEELKKPTGYGSVSLKATVNGFSVGDAWSKKYTHTEDTEHAEDAAVDFVEYCALWIGWKKYPPDASTALKSVIDSMAKDAKMQLEITDLTASPCSTAQGTCKKKNSKGCSERLIALKEQLKKDGYKTVSISVSAAHYYQPQGVDGAKKKSEAAKGDLEKAGITVTITGS